jgi:hypothetical protein
LWSGEDHLLQEREPDPKYVRKYYEQCLYIRGWAKIPLDQRDRSLWQWKERNLYFETFTMELPSGFSLRTQAKFVVGPAWSHQLQAVGKDQRTFLILVAQKNIADPFEIIDYPLPEGYVLYTKGRLDNFDVHWSVFTGHYQQNLVAILGAYIYLEKTQRVSLVFSRTLTSAGKAVDGYTLSLLQKDELDQLYPAWLSWIKTQTGAKKAEEKPGLGRYFHFFY